MKNNKRQLIKSGGAQILAAAILAGGLATIVSGIPSIAAQSDGIFMIKAADSSGYSSVAGIEANLISDGEGTPSGEAAFQIDGVSNDYFTKKSGDGKPVIRIPAFELDGSAIKTTRDWTLSIPKSKVPFNHGNVVLKTGLPGWAKIAYEDDNIVISSNGKFGLLGGSVKVLKFDPLEFSYDVPSYTASETKGELIKQNDGRIDVKVSTLKTDQFSYGKWSTTIDVTAIRAELNNSDGKFELNTAIVGGISGYALTPISGNTYTLSYNGTNQNNYIKGIGAVSELEDPTTGYAEIAGLVKFAPGTPAAVEDKNISNAEGNVALTQSQSGRTVTLTYKKLPPRETHWNIDVDLSDLVKINPANTPKINNGAHFSMVKKIGNIYTVSYNGTGWPAVGGSVTIQLP